MSAASALLSVRGLGHRYEGVLALDGIDLDIRAAGFLAVLGPNGAGKSTLAQVMCGTLRPASGSLLLDGRDVTGWAGQRGLVAEGLALIPEGRRLFGQLSVEENLALGAYGQPASERRRRFAEVIEMMPERLRQNRQQAAVTLSGGEQQMLAIGRALMAAPRAIFVDEPSLGLAPILTDQVYRTLAELRQRGVAVVVFEQLATQAMRYADEIVVLNHGRVSHQGRVGDDATRAAIRIGYLGHE
jgi:branched-chain amino acid transport system ATP-binding protein